MSWNLGFSHLEILGVRGFDIYCHSYVSYTDNTWVGQGWFPLRTGTEIGLVVFFLHRQSQYSVPWIGIFSQRQIGIFSQFPIF
jgi:hypothetical protein